MPTLSRLRIAVVGTGVSGLSAAWLLSQRHEVTVYEQAERVGGHSHTVVATIDGRSAPVDTGFIVFNRLTYPNLTALFDRLGVATEASEMSFGVSLDDGDLEYSGTALASLFAQRRNLLRPPVWSMVADLLRFYRHARHDALALADENITLGEYLDRGGYGIAFREDHILPMASAIWWSSPAEILRYPAAAFLRFNNNHGLLQVNNRPLWETVTGGSVTYVGRLTAAFAGRIRRGAGIVSVLRQPDGLVVCGAVGRRADYDHVVLATHADQALKMLANPTPDERALLGAFRYSRNFAVLHSDESFMPRRRGVWSSWNYMGPRGSRGQGVYVTYWMNRLQNIKSRTQVFVTLNPPRPPHAGTLHRSEIYEHPIFDRTAMAAQRHLWSLQGVHRTWFCGAYFGAGFHEDGLQAGLAVAEDLGGLRRPWTVSDESGRIFRTPSPTRSVEALP